MTSPRMMNGTDIFFLVKIIHSRKESFPHRARVQMC